MDLRNALELIQDTARQAATPQVVDIEHSTNEHQTLLLMPDGSVKEIVADFPPRRHTVFDIDSLAIWAADQKDATVWHSDSQVVLVRDDHRYRENRVTMPLPVHPKFAALERETAGAFDQKRLIQFLRLNLKEEVAAAHHGFIAMLREIKFRRSDSGQSSVQVGRESMGRDIEEKVSGIDETQFPEELTLLLPIWLQLDCYVTVPIQFDVDVAECSFIFRPKPGAIAQAKVAAQKWLHDELSTACESCPILHGTP